MTRTNSRVYLSRSEEETIQLGRRLAQSMGPKAVVLLIGDLGAGKTTIAKGIASGANGTDPDEVSSPTFTLVHEYRGEPPVYHVDLYRLDEEAEVESVGLDDLFRQEGIVLIEWGERFPRLMPCGRWEICLESVTAEPEKTLDLRQIVVSAPEGVCLPDFGGRD